MYVHIYSMYVVYTHIYTLILPGVEVTAAVVVRHVQL